jgi:hypothetical protein
MTSTNVDADVEKEFKPEDTKINRQIDSATLIQMLNQWLADESGYDEENWPKVEKLLEENRTSDRSVFHE